MPNRVFRGPGRAGQKCEILGDASCGYASPLAYSQTVKETWDLKNLECKDLIGKLQEHKGFCNLDTEKQVVLLISAIPSAKSVRLINPIAK